MEDNFILTELNCRGCKRMIKIGEMFFDGYCGKCKYIINKGSRTSHKKMRYRIKFDGHYVKEVDYTYLVECNEKESNFSEVNANMIKEACPVRTELLKIIGHEYMEEKNES